VIHESRFPRPNLETRNYKKIAREVRVNFRHRETSSNFQKAEHDDVIITRLQLEFQGVTVFVCLF
jgi:hypothetical protein